MGNEKSYTCIFCKGVDCNRYLDEDVRAAKVCDNSQCGWNPPVKQERHLKIINGGLQKNIYGLKCLFLGEAEPENIMEDMT